MDDTTGARRGAVRDGLVDGGLVVLAVTAGFYPAVAWWAGQPTLPPWLQNLDYAAGAIGCLALWWRRRFPLVLAVVMAVVSTFSLSVSAAALIALLTLAVHRPARHTAVLAVAYLLSFGVYLVLRPDRTVPVWLLVALQVALVVGVAGWGMLVRSRRQLVASLRERAEAAEVAARLRAERSQHEAREALAREMHDVLGHRLSLLSVHAGALAYYRGASAEEIARAAEVVRENARRALQDLREVIGVLRTPERDRPLPGVEDVVELVDETRRAGTPVELRDVSGVTPGGRAVPATVGRTLYRLVQEGLTNARKHAPGAPVLVRITGDPGDHLSVEVINARPPLAPPAGVAPAIGSGEGLRGLAERATLVGGRLEHGPTRTGGWRLGMRLRWPA
ncbi:sensor histidine kinase [Pseudonocardia kunmingensis]|uniref:histidine kinase n=1 Tax=Pseudonocardia kunmingensis TaxID=630975 RepID=A0A543E0B3_9PSEU|nr:histidine kinase [Pseudonocardia kunmingensis]TQM15018.1 signal transduction histidine kinase [Pseudonocardia kunmingensis]